MPRKSANGAARPKYTSVKAAAEMYDVDEVTVRRWIASGLIHGYRIGGRLIKVDLAEIDAQVVQEVPAAGIGR